MIYRMRLRYLEYLAAKRLRQAEERRQRAEHRARALARRSAAPVEAPAEAPEAPPAPAPPAKRKVKVKAPEAVPIEDAGRQGVFAVAPALRRRWRSCTGSSTGRRC